MYFETYTDKLKTMRDSIRKNSNPKEVFDWVADEALTQHACYLIIKDTIINNYGKNTWDEIEKLSARDFMKIQELHEEYFVKVHKKHSGVYELLNKYKNEEKIIKVRPTKDGKIERV